MLYPDTPEPTNITISKKNIMVALGIKRRKMFDTEQDTENINTDMVKNESYDSAEQGIGTGKTMA